jgi:hypothetical protein
MKNKYYAKLLSVIALSASCSANALNLSFEDLDPSPSAFEMMPSLYLGFTFTGWYYGPDTLYTPASGVIDLFTDYADPSDPGAYVITVNNAISSSTPFVFQGASFAGYSGVTFELYLGGSLVHTSSSLPDAPSVDPYLPTFLSSGYGQAVDTVKVSGVQGYYSMDDFQYQAVTSPIPEPSTYALLLGGLGMVAWGARRQRK